MDRQGSRPNNSRPEPLFSFFTKVSIPTLGESGEHPSAGVDYLAAIRDAAGQNPGLYTVRVNAQRKTRQVSVVASVRIDLRSRKGSIRFLHEGRRNSMNVYKIERTG
jgi:hypothetical protein